MCCIVLCTVCTSLFHVMQGVEVVKERHDAAERLLKRIVHEAAGTAADNVGKAELTWVSCFLSLAPNLALCAACALQSKSHLMWGIACLCS